MRGVAELLDTHCHIQSAGNKVIVGERATRDKWAKAPERTPEIIINQAVSYGVTRMICVGCDLADSQLAIDFAGMHPECWASIGIHPHEAENALQNAHVDAFAALVTSPKVIAVGECGLDYYYTHSSKDAQIEVLKFQMKLAQQQGLPMIFHVREALDDFWPIFDRISTGAAPVRGVLHSFTDTADHLAQALQRGLYIGVNGIATFTKDHKQLDMYKKIPLSRLLLETDAPFLTPSPYRGTICEPYHIKVIAEFLSSVRRESFDDLARVTTENAHRLFNLE